MKRIFGSLLAPCLLLVGCGGGLQSPDFEAVLRGVQVTSIPAAATVAPGSAIQFTAQGLYSTPPGTKQDSTTVDCGDDLPGVCTVGAISGVTWSVDPYSNNVTGAVASIDANGRASGLKRTDPGVPATIRAKASGFEGTAPLTVDGEVLESFTISSAEGDTVPTGRSFTLTATPLCSRTKGATPTNCTRTDYSFNWALSQVPPVAADAVTFTPNPPVGRTISVRTRKFGPFSIESVINNEEGTAVRSSIPLNASNRVLDDIVVMAVDGQAEPVGVVIRVKTQLVAKGIFSNGETDDITAADLGGSGRLTWAKDPTAVGDITIEDSTTGPNTTVLVSGVQVGTTGITATGSNTESPALALDDRAAILVKNLGLVRVSSICRDVPNSTLCEPNVQIPNGTTVQFKARGVFEGDTAGLERDLDPTQFPLAWSTTAGTGIVQVVDAARGSFMGTQQGVVTLNVTLADPDFEPQVSDRSESVAAVVVDPFCVDQLLTANNTIASSDNGATAPSEVANTGNVIDGDPITAGTFTIGAALTEGSLSMIFQRVATVVTPPPAGMSVGFLLQYAQDEFDAEDLSELQTLNAAGEVVQTLNLAVSTVQGANGEPAQLASTIVTQPFSGLRLNVVVPSVAAVTPVSGGTLDPSLVTSLLTLLGGGGSVDVDVFAACGQVLQ